MKRDIIHALIHIAHIHKRVTHRMLEEQSISMGQPPILRYLSQHDGCIQRELSTNCHVKPASITSALDTMEQQGVIERRALPGDRRGKRVFLTDAGREKHERVKEVFRQVEDICLADLDEAQLAALQSMLQRVFERLQRQEEGMGNAGVVDP